MRGYLATFGPQASRLEPHAGREGIWLVVMSLLFVAAGCERKEPAPAEVTRPVKTMVVTGGDDPRERSFPGTVEASRRVELAFQVSGLLVSLPVKEGQRVAHGELIAQLRQEEFQARLGSLQGQLDQARAELLALRAGERIEEQLRREAQVRAATARLANAKAERDRFTQMLERRAASRSEFEIAETAYLVALEDYNAAVQLAEKGTMGREEAIMALEAQVRGLESQVVEANLNLRDSTLLAPYDGVIAQRFVEEGQNIQASAPVVRFQDTEEVEILVDIPETVMAAEIRRSDIVEMIARLSGAPGLQFPVQLREIAQVADPTTQTFSVRVAMQAPEGIRALPGMTATVTVAYRPAEVLGHRIQIPVSAVSKRGEGKQVVWLIGPDNRVSSRPVTLGSVSGRNVEVTEGLQPGDRLVTAGVVFLREDMQVHDLGDALGVPQS